MPPRLGWELDLHGGNGGGTSKTACLTGGNSASDLNFTQSNEVRSESCPQARRLGCTPRAFVGAHPRTRGLVTENTSELRSHSVDPDTNIAVPP